MEQIPPNERRTAMIDKVRHWWRNIQWLQRFKTWRYTKVPVVFGCWSVWARGDVVLHRVYWRGWWTPFVEVRSRFEQRFMNCIDSILKDGWKTPRSVLPEGDKK
jgi:hypothetical protein